MATRAKRHPKVSDAQYIARWKARTTVTADGCWHWNGHVQTKGYAEACYRNKCRRIARLVYQLLVGPIPKGKLVCHHCDNRRCWNPAHLWLGTNRENMVDCSRKGRAWKQQNTACKRGHTYTPETVRLLDMGMTKKRVCKICARINMRVRMGWPLHLAKSLPPTPRGYTRYGEPCKRQS
jgi:hypothetical protein